MITVCSTHTHTHTIGGVGDECPRMRAPQDTVTVRRHVQPDPRSLLLHPNVVIQCAATSGEAVGGGEQDGGFL